MATVQRMTAPEYLARPACPSFDVALELAPQDTLASPLLPGFALSVGKLIDG